MERSFNTTGPCFADEHYMLPPERRLGRVLDLLRHNKYFVLHAGRQTGKTTSLMWLESFLPTQGKRALRLDLQTARDNPDPATALRTVFNRLALALEVPHDGLRAPDPAQVTEWLTDPASALLHYLRFLAAQDPRPFVLLLDEADCLAGDTMVTVLTQLRDGYLSRRQIPFPSSIALVGMRSVRDYVVRKEDQRVISWLGTSSPFNISAESAILSSFTEPEVTELLSQHTTDTGQVFTPEAVSRTWELAEGHPWLTNALADQVVRNDVRDRSVPVTRAHIDAAKETILLERRSHIDSLVARLREPRIARILSPMLAGERAAADDVLHDDFAYAVGLGLLQLKDGQYQIANPIYREVIPRALTFDQQAQIHEKPLRYVRPDGGLDMAALMAAWQTFWRKDGHLAAGGFGYREAGPHLMLMAFLQRILYAGAKSSALWAGDAGTSSARPSAEGARENTHGGGRIEREYGLGRGALDLMVFWKNERHAIEVKLRRDTETEAEALDQVTDYLDHAGLDEGWLVLFDLRKDLSWADKLTTREATRPGKRVHVVGC
ncbi:MAG: ATP-binding protein [Polyangiaceae bacterium]